MEIANVMVAIAGDSGNTVPKFGVTAAEIAVLRVLHGDDAVFDIEPAGTVDRTHRTELARLSEIYGVRQPDGGTIAPAVQRLYPGAAARVFETLEELDIPEEMFKPVERRKGVTAKAAETAKAEIERAQVEGTVDNGTMITTDTDPRQGLDDMTVAELRKWADEQGVDLTGITKKADIIDAIKTADLESHVDDVGVPAPDARADKDEDGDGIADMPDSKLFE